eukprot:CAMPEP_0203682008 /NCGR_PEP_ID=MMETSP0090-20130426/44408_1 /ASSEMBLY_ACC=CAM_ASM_001088 /TAXON_ID=426623 /ORGANISM="Chaetoceros affinis, Strain CCMP159" /LENGTH=190 /DNA_ID=CAMNT_0050550735 /DNA_START=104 /DNA_END=673 /DNA_ORIENTATION=+
MVLLVVICIAATTTEAFVVQSLLTGPRTFTSTRTSLFATTSTEEGKGKSDDVNVQASGSSTNTNTSTNMKSPGTTITENDVKNNKEQVIEIPRAIDPMNDINALFAVDNCSNKLHIRKGNSIMNEYDNVIPSTVKSTRGLLDMPLGKVVEEKVTGLGVKVVAYHCCDEGEGNDDEVDDSTKDTDDIHDME